MQKILKKFYHPLGIFFFIYFFFHVGENHGEKSLNWASPRGTSKDQLSWRDGLRVKVKENCFGNLRNICARLLQRQDGLLIIIFTARLTALSNFSKLIQHFCLISTLLYFWLRVAKQGIQLKAKENIRIKTYLKPFLAYICLPNRPIAAYLH